MKNDANLLANIDTLQCGSNDGRVVISHTHFRTGNPVAKVNNESEFKVALLNIVNWTVLTESQS